MNLHEENQPNNKPHRTEIDSFKEKGFDETFASYGVVPELGELVAPCAISLTPSPSSHPSPTALEKAEVIVDHEQEKTSNKGHADTSPGSTSLINSISSLGTAIGSTACYSLTGVFNQAAKGNATELAQYPNPFIYGVLRSSVASIATYIKDRSYFKQNGLVKTCKEMGRDGYLMCGAMAANNLLWIPAFLLTDLASACVIAGAQPFAHSIYESIKARKAPSALKLTALSFTGAALASVVANQSIGAGDYPYATWGNLAAIAASCCFVAYNTINNRSIAKAKDRAVSPQMLEDINKIESTTHREEALLRANSLRNEAEGVAKARLKPVPFFSQAASAATCGIALSVPMLWGGIFSGGMGLNPLNTILMGTLHGGCTAAGLYLRTLATQTTKPSVVSLISGVQVGLTPLFGYLLFGSSVPSFAIMAGSLALCSSLISVAEVHLDGQRKR